MHLVSKCSLNYTVRFWFLLKKPFLLKYFMVPFVFKVLVLYVLHVKLAYKI